MPEKSKARRVDADREATALLAAQLEAAKTERVPEIMTLVLFALFVAAFAISFWIAPDRDFSENENRVLASFPKLTLESLTADEDNRKFTTKFADYMADQFPLRDAFVGAKAAFEIALGRRENNGVFVLGDTLAERHDSLDETNFERNAGAMEAFAAACRDRGAIAQVAVFARAMDVAEIPIYGSAATDRAFAAIGGRGFLDMREALDGHGDEYVYYRTDHHHTTLGAYYAYRCLAEKLGYEANDISHYRREIASDSFFGTTWSKAGAKWIAPDTIEYFRWDGDEDVTVTVAASGGEAVVHDGMYFTEYLEKKDKYASFLDNSVYGRVDVTCGEGRAKLLVVKDSFAHSLVPFLAEHFDVTMIDPRYYKRPIISLVDDEGFDAVLVMCNMDTLSSAASFAILKMGLE